MIRTTLMPVKKVTLPRSTIVPDVTEFLEIKKPCKPSVTTFELQQRLVLDCTVHLPSRSVITKCMRADLVMAKKIQKVPLEAKTLPNVENVNFFLHQLSDLLPTSIHLFDKPAWKNCYEQT